MNSDKKVLRYAPDLYKKNADMLAVYDIQEIEIDRMDNKTRQAFLNNFVLTSDLEGVRRWEAIFNILADEVNENLDFRKQRILNRLLQLPPFTKLWIALYLEGLYGERKYDILIKYNEYYFWVAIETQDDTMYRQTLKDIRQIIPANMTLEALKLEKYLHWYLNRNYTYGELEQFTYGELSRYANTNIIDTINLKTDNVWVASIRRKDA